MSRLDTQDVTWLVVGGAPRSGTTALGAALNQSTDVALLHEYSSKVLFDSLNILFSEELRMRTQPDFDRYSHLFPIRDRDEKIIAQAVFRAVFKKDARFIGTKFPGHHAWPQPAYPEWLGFKEIHITRNPFDVVLSMVKKDHSQGVKPADVENALYWWINAWNHTIDRAAADDFLNVFYDSLVVDHAEWHRKITDFLGEIGDFSLGEFRSTSSVVPSIKYGQANMSEYLPLIECVAKQEDWLAGAIAAYQNRQKIGFPLLDGQEIDLRRGSSGWRYIDSGFYSAEDGGAWTCGRQSELLFTLDGEYSGSISLSFDIVWAAEVHERGRDVVISLNSKTVFHSVVSLGSRNGAGTTLSIFVPDFEWKARSTVSLKLQVVEPVNPRREGLGDDNRELGIMIRKISLSKL
ncbi:sulfotransferase [Paraburkholderia metrosideri]|uniref:Sulfotransferase n=1 Tax=Paraburkholderia metrosideri TaxID=580937 RepID=A0ABW9DZD3_9BURK